jgi:hypothetical protein
VYGLREMTGYTNNTLLESTIPAKVFELLRYIIDIYCDLLRNTARTKK